MLRNYFEKSQRTCGPKGEDKFKDLMVIIYKGKIATQGIASSLASRSPLAPHKNGYNDLKPGEYRISKGGESSGYGRFLRVFYNKQRMENNNYSVPSSLGMDRQRWILIHWPAGTKLCKKYSGGVGCQLNGNLTHGQKEILLLRSGKN